MCDLSGTTTYSGCVGIEIQAPDVRINGGVVRLDSYKHSSETYSGNGSVGIWCHNLNYDPAPASQLKYGRFATINCDLVDGDGFNGSVAIKLSDAMYGIRGDCTIGDGWTGTNDRVLVVEHNTIRDCQFVFRGVQSDLLSSPGKYVDLPANWRGDGDVNDNDYNNSVILIRSDTGQTLTLLNQAY